MIGPEELQAVMMAIGKLHQLPDIAQMIKETKKTDAWGNPQ